MYTSNLLTCQTPNGPVGTPGFDIGFDIPPALDAEASGSLTPLAAKKFRRSNLALLTKVSKTHRKGRDSHQFDLHLIITDAYGSEH